MSKGVFGQHADDPQWVFLAWEPVPGPRWRAVLAVMLGLAAAGLMASVTTGRAQVVLTIATLVFVVLPAWPRSSMPEAPTLEQFDRMRRAGALALERFRVAHPEVVRTSWYVAERRADGSLVIDVSGQTRDTPLRGVDCSWRVVITDAGVIADAPPRDPEATVYVQGWQRELVASRPWT